MYYPQVGVMVPEFQNWPDCQQAQNVMDTHIFPYFSVFYTDLFGEDLVSESLSLDMIKWLVMCCHHVHSKSHEVSCDIT